MGLVAKLKAGAGGVLARCGAPIGSRTLARLIYGLVQVLAHGRPAKESLVFLLELERQLFILTGTEACRYGGGVHTKHRHTRYHEFFVERVRPGERVLDVGCGNGALSYDLAQVGARVTGVELNREHVEFGRRRYTHPNLELRHGDVLRDLPGQSFDTVVMSNVLEHLEERVDFLRRVQATAHPRRWLLRVPLYERDWRVPLMAELGIDYRLDDTHYIEYTQEQFADELRAAGLAIVHQEIRWGEIWCEAAPRAADGGG